MFASSTGFLKFAFLQFFLMACVWGFLLTLHQQVQAEPGPVRRAWREWLASNLAAMGEVVTFLCWFVGFVVAVLILADVCRRQWDTAAVDALLFAGNAFNAFLNRELSRYNDPRL